MINPIGQTNQIDLSDKIDKSKIAKRDSIEFSEYSIKLSEYVRELRRLEDVRADLVKRMNALSYNPSQMGTPSELACLCRMIASSCSRV